MQNELKLKKFFLFSLIISAIFLLVFIFLNIYEYQTITKNYNYQIAALITNLKNHEPQLSETEIIKILNSNSKANLELFNKYGIFLTKASTVLANKKLSTTYLFLNITFFLILIIIFITMLILYSKKTSKEIKDLTKYLEEINKKNYDLKIALNTEDELSILKNEIYKTTIMLKEIAEINQNEKLNLKKSLEDISHQLKTPLTSILIMLDNILDEENMPNQTKNEFLRDIKSQILNINFLVEALLKLAKFDANTIEFTKEKTSLQTLVNAALKNVSSLSDLKNITIKISGQEEAFLNCDLPWQIEALTNILKNSLDHSKPNSILEINYAQNNIYAFITIKDYGEGISKKDINHIFERFYKGSNANPDSVGIGLALAKTIIEKNNGTISVISSPKGTTFTIKYYH